MAEIEYEDQFSCPVCLEPLKEPVTIPCGHSYCLHCINDYWSQKTQEPPYLCPQCRESFTQKPLLKKNTLLAEMMEKLEKPSHQTSSWSQENSGVDCDVCTADKNQAVMSCLQCLASFCESHLQPHHQSPVFMKHKLVKASTQVQENICVRHGKLMEIYCQDDNQCICYLCMIDSHKGHSVASVESEWSKKKKELQQTNNTCTTMIQCRESRQIALAEAAESFKSSANEAVEECKKVFSDLISSFEKKCSEITDLIRVQEKDETDRVGNFKRQLDQELTELRQRKMEIEELLMMENQVNFLKGFQSVCVLPKCKDFPAISHQPLKSFQRIPFSGFRDVLEDVCQKETAKISLKVPRIYLADPELPESRNELLQYFCQLNVDPNTAHQCLILSERNKKISGTVEEQDYPYHPERFDSLWYIMCKEALRGRCYWEVECTGKNWALAVCYKGICRRGTSDNCRFGFNKQSWRFGYFRQEFGFFHDKMLVPLNRLASKIGVYLDYNAGLLSFYNLSSAMNPIFSFKTSFAEPVYPAFQILSDSSVRIIERDGVHTGQL